MEWFASKQTCALPALTFWIWGPHHRTTRLFQPGAPGDQARFLVAELDFIGFPTPWRRSITLPPADNGRPIAGK